MSDTIVTKDALAAAVTESGFNTRALSKRFGVTERSIQRALVRYKMRPKHKRPPMPLDKGARIRQLAAEGMPVTWIAEDVGLPPDWVYKYLGPRPVEARQWREAWSAIRRSEELTELHRQFTAPDPRLAGLRGEKKPHAHLQ